MAIKPLRVKQHDLQPYYRFSTPGVNLTGAVIVCTMAADGVKRINRQSAGVIVTDAVNGEAEYRWQAGETDTVGTYSIEFEITPQAGGKFTLPVGEKAEVIIEPDKDGV